MREFSSSKRSQAPVVLFALLIGCWSCVAEEPQQPSAVEQLKLSLESLERQIDSAQTKLSEVQAILNQLKNEIRVPAEPHIEPTMLEAASHGAPAEEKPQSSQVTVNQDVKQVPTNNLDGASRVEPTRVDGVGQLQHDLDRQPPVAPQQTEPNKQLAPQVTDSPAPSPDRLDHANHLDNKQQQPQDVRSNQVSSVFESRSEAPGQGDHHHYSEKSSSSWSSSQMNAAESGQGAQNNQNLNEQQNQGHQEIKFVENYKLKGVEEELENLSFPRTRGSSAFDLSQISGKIRDVFENQVKDLPNRIKNSIRPAQNQPNQDHQSDPEPRSEPHSEPQWEPQPQLQPQSHQYNDQGANPFHSGEQYESSPQSPNYHRSGGRRSSARRWLHEKVHSPRGSGRYSEGLEQARDDRASGRRHRLSNGIKRALSAPKRLLSEHRDRRQESYHSSIKERARGLVERVGSDEFGERVIRRGERAMEAVKRQGHDLEGLVQYQGDRLAQKLVHGVQEAKYRAREGLSRARGLFRGGRQYEEGPQDGQRRSRNILKRFSKVPQENQLQGHSYNYHPESGIYQHQSVQMPFYHQSSHQPNHQPSHQSSRQPNHQPSHHPMRPAHEPTRHNHQQNDLQQPRHGPNNHAPHYHKEDDSDVEADDEDADDYEDDDEGFDGPLDIAQFNRENPDRKIARFTLEDPEERRVSKPFDRAVPDMLGRLPNVPPVDQTQSG